MEIGAYVICMWCSFIVTSTFRTDILTPKWTQQFSNENLTDVPKYVIQLQDRILYPTRRFLQSIFSGRYQRDKSRMLQVRVQRTFPFETPQMLIISFHFSENPKASAEVDQVRLRHQRYPVLDKTDERT